MAELYQITEKSFELFRPLLSKEAVRDYMTDPDILAIGAVEDSEAAGILLLKITDLMLFITYLYVSEPFRRRGVASDLLCRAKSIAFKSDKPLQALFYAVDGNDPFLALFASRPGYSLEEQEDKFFRMPVEELLSLKERIPRNRHEFSVRPFGSLSFEEEQEFERICRDNGKDYYNPFASNYYSPLCLVAKSGSRIRAVMLSTCSEEELEIHYVTGASPFALMELFRAVPDIVREKLPDRVKTVRIIAVNEASEKLIRYLFPKAEPSGAFFMASVDIY